jgi:hypothetical protein
MQSLSRFRIFDCFGNAVVRVAAKHASCDSALPAAPLRGLS